jgi:hypothetical protein
VSSVELVAANTKRFVDLAARYATGSLHDASISHSYYSYI